MLSKHSATELVQVGEELKNGLGQKVETDLTCGTIPCKFTHTYTTHTTTHMHIQTHPHTYTNHSYTTRSHILHTYLHIQTHIFTCTTHPDTHTSPTYTNSLIHIDRNLTYRHTTHTHSYTYEHLTHSSYALIHIYTPTLSHATDIYDTPYTRRHPHSHTHTHSYIHSSHIPHTLPHIHAHISGRQMYHRLSLLRAFRGKNGNI